MGKQTVLNDYMQDIGGLFNKTQKMNEFEIDFNMDKQSITYERYIDMLRYIARLHATKGFEIQKTTTLDINYNETTGKARDNYRISIDGIDLINKHINLLHERGNHVIFNVMMNIIRDGKYHDSINVYKKTKMRDDIIDIPDVNMRIRLSSEDRITSKDIKELFQPLDETQAIDITLRYKQRLTAIVENNKDYIIKIDLTNTKTTNNINNLDNVIPVYELELEFKPNTQRNDEKILDKIMSESLSLLKVLQQSNYIITKTTSDEVIDEYRRLIASEKQTFNLDGRAPVSLEIQHATEILANKYAAVDKADGDRYFLIICNGHAYLISQNLKVKDTGIKMKDNSYDGTILDCEYVYMPKFKRYAILPFDCLFAKDEDIRKMPNLMDRIAIAQKVINDCFIFGKQTGYKPKEFKEKNTVDNIMKYYIGQLDEYVNMLIHDAEIEKQYPLIRVKFFMPVYGLADNEIFKYSMIIWNKYMYDEIKYPYSLDGIIYQPLIQAYVTNIRESKQSDYKWKPPEKNTIDFFIRFEKDRSTGKIVTVYDNSNADYELNKPYRICYLYNGKKTRDGETPVFFNEEQKMYIAHLFVEDDCVKDVKGDILQDETVVEFYYNNSLEINEKFRWVPLKTRYDKTEMVNKYKMKFGNNTDVAARIWRSISVPVKISDIASLSDDAMYTKHLNEMRSKITRELIVSAAKENVYYQIKTNLAEPMRNFHNWIKSITIFTYMGSDYSGRPLSVLDIGCGRGGDLMKFYHAKIANAVCIDIDYETLHNALDGAISRYEGHRKKYPAFPRMNIVCADFTVPLDPESQLNVILDKTPSNKALLEKSFPKTGMIQFDRINAQFSFHYFLANEKSWETTCANINKCLKPGGIMVITTFDAQRVLELFKKDPKYTIYYTVNGEKKILMEIIKKFSDDKKIGVGMAIDVYNGLISNEEVYNTEYLVDKTFLVNELKEKCDMELVDTDMFDHQYEIHRDNITRVANYDENEKTRSFFQTVATYYEQTDLNTECFKITRLNRHYVFRKMENSRKK